MEGLTRTEPPLSRDCCVGPALYPPIMVSSVTVVTIIAMDQAGSGWYGMTLNFSFLQSKQTSVTNP